MGKIVTNSKHFVSLLMDFDIEIQFCYEANEVILEDIFCLLSLILIETNLFKNSVIMSSDAAFFGDGSKVISATVDANGISRAESSCNVEDYYELSRCVEWLNSNSNVSKVSN